EHAVREFATHGDCVFLGRVAGRVLRDHGGVLRVFICAPSEWRVTHLIAALGLDERTARSEIQRIDAGREEYARTWYDVELADARNYDLTLDSSRYGVDGSVELILAALHAGADPA
ncbi:MAG: AAA family ATPase, partial [Vulcanimicrobiaceae bacterium]